MGTPSVSVIIPFSKPDLVEVALNKLVQQTCPADEIIVVGQHSSTLTSRWPVRAIETAPIYYPGEARNIGARAAKGEYLLFLDDDCEPAADWIEECQGAFGSENRRGWRPDCRKVEGLFRAVRRFQQLCLRTGQSAYRDACLLSKSWRATAGL